MSYLMMIGAESSFFELSLNQSDVRRRGEGELKNVEEFPLIAARVITNDLREWLV